MLVDWSYRTYSQLPCTTVSHTFCVYEILELYTCLVLWSLSWLSNKLAKSSSQVQELSRLSCGYVEHSPIMHADRHLKGKSQSLGGYGSDLALSDLDDRWKSLLSVLHPELPICPSQLSVQEWSDASPQNSPLYALQQVYPRFLHLAQWSPVPVVQPLQFFLRAESRCMPN